jgi:hypothetical protein
MMVLVMHLLNLNQDHREVVLTPGLVDLIGNPEPSRSSCPQEPGSVLLPGNSFEIVWCACIGGVGGGLTSRHGQVSNNSKD